MLVEDPEGAPLADWDSARADAVQAAKELVIGALQTKALIDDRQLEIHDPQGQVISVIRLVDVLPLRGRPFALA